MTLRIKMRALAARWLYRMGDRLNGRPRTLQDPWGPQPLEFLSDGELIQELKRRHDILLLAAGRIMRAGDQSCLVEVYLRGSRGHIRTVACGVVELIEQQQGEAG